MKNGVAPLHIYRYIAFMEAMHKKISTGPCKDRFFLLFVWKRENGEERNFRELLLSNFVGQ